MGLEKRINGKVVRVTSGDITELAVDGFVFYATPNLKLGTGVGNAVSLRGGPRIQEELSGIGPKSVGEAVATGAGKLKASCIIHAVGPAFQEAKTKEKLRRVMESSLKVASDKGLHKVAFPPMGTGFFGIPMDLSAKVMSETIGQFLGQATPLQEITICVLDPWDIPVYEEALNALN
jgi:O-acetyl-ADP-ribose deacetylase (regulator of RNase III)